MTDILPMGVVLPASVSLGSKRLSGLRRPAPRAQVSLPKRLEGDPIPPEIVPEQRCQVGCALPRTHYLDTVPEMAERKVE